MKEKLKRIKEVVEQHAPAVIATAIVTALGCALYYYKSNQEWNSYVLTQEQRDMMAASSDATVTFFKQKVIITGKDWDPIK